MRLLGTFLYWDRLSNKKQGADNLAVACTLLNVSGIGTYDCDLTVLCKSKGPFHEPTSLVSCSAIRAVDVSES